MRRRFSLTLTPPSQNPSAPRRLINRGHDPPIQPIPSAYPLQIPSAARPRHADRAPAATHDRHRAAQPPLRATPAARRRTATTVSGMAIAFHCKNTSSRVWGTATTRRRADGSGDSNSNRRRTVGCSNR